MSAPEQAKSSTGMDAKSPDNPEEIREDIEQTRNELGETVAALAEKTDVKQQAQLKAEELKGQASEKARELGEKAKEIAPESAGEGMQQAQRLAQENPMPVALAGTFLAGFLLGRLFSR
jgi:chromosome segregation ATPase